MAITNRDVNSNNLCIFQTADEENGKKPKFGFNLSSISDIYVYAFENDQSERIILVKFSNGLQIVP